MRFSSLIAAASLIAVFACSKKDDKATKKTPVKTTTDAAAKKTVTPTPTPTPTPEPTPEEIAKEPAVKLARASSKEICACTDYPCARAVVLKFSKEMQQVQKERGSGKLPPARRRAFVAAYNQFQQCHNKLAPKGKRLANRRAAGNAEAGKMGEFARSMCKCKDGACGRKVYAEVMKWNKEQFAGGKRTLTPEHVANFKAAQVKLVNCYKPLINKGGDTATKR